MQLKLFLVLFKISLTRASFMKPLMLIHLTKMVYLKESMDTLKWLDVYCTTCLFQNFIGVRPCKQLASRGKLYYHQIKQPAVSNVEVSTFMSNAMLWHDWLSHPNLSKLKLLVPSLVSESCLNCETCQLSKHHKESHLCQSNSKSYKPFELVHSDVWGPLNVPNFGNYKFCVLFIDDHTSLIKCQVWL